MTDTRDTGPHAHLWARLARHRTAHTLQYRVVHFGFWSTFIFSILMFLDVFAPSLFQGHYVAIAVIYLVFQLAEIASRDPLNWAEVAEGCGFALMPGLAALLIKGIDWYSGYSVLNPIGRDVMNLWFWFAWICFGFGVVMSMKILSTPYRRDESRVPPT